MSVIINGLYRQPDGTPATGEVVFTLEVTDENASPQYSHGPIYVSLTDQGFLAAELVSDITGDSAGDRWLVDERVTGNRRLWWLRIPPGTTTIDLPGVFPGDGLAVPESSGTSTSDSFDTVYYPVQGPKGEQGLRGKAGPHGPKGEMGIAGKTGPEGKAGEPGPKGERGSSGKPGPRGLKGEKGDQGEKGPQGDRGRDGKQGPPGTTTTVLGSGGLTGRVGPQGPPGPRGPAGTEPGPRGPAGVAGPRGVPGDTGQGIPAGGPEGHGLVKSSALDYDVNWTQYPMVTTAGIGSDSADPGKLMVGSIQMGRHKIRDLTPLAIDPYPGVWLPHDAAPIELVQQLIADAALGDVTITLGDISDVDLDPPPADGDTIVWDETTNTWIPGTPAATADIAAGPGIAFDQVGTTTHIRVDAGAAIENTVDGVAVKVDNVTIQVNAQDQLEVLSADSMVIQEGPGIQVDTVGNLTVVAVDTGAGIVQSPDGIAVSVDGTTIQVNANDQLEVISDLGAGDGLYLNPAGTEINVGAGFAVTVSDDLVSVDQRQLDILYASARHDLDSHIDVSTTGATEGQVLTMGPAGEWIPGSVTASGTLTEGPGIDVRVSGTSATVEATVDNLSLEIGPKPDEKIRVKAAGIKGLHLDAPIGSLSDVNTDTNPNPGQALLWSGVAQQWMPGDVSTQGTGPLALEDLTDVSGTTDPNDGQHLAYDASTDQWVPVDPPAETLVEAGAGTEVKQGGSTGTAWLVSAKPDNFTLNINTTAALDSPFHNSIQIADQGVKAIHLDAPLAALSDVTEVKPTQGQALVYSAITELWSPGDVAPATGPIALDDLSDVTAPAPTDGQTLVFDEATGEWVAADLPPAPLPTEIPVEIVVGGTIPAPGVDAMWATTSTMSPPVPGEPLSSLWAFDSTTGPTQGWHEVKLGAPPEVTVHDGSMGDLPASTVYQLWADTSQTFTVAA